MCVCDLVGYQNQVYNVRILELWFSTLITCGNYLGNIKKCWYLGATLPSFIWLVWGVAWASVPSVMWFSYANKIDKVERLYSRDSFWTYSVQICNSFLSFSQRMDSISKMANLQSWNIFWSQRVSSYWKRQGTTDLSVRIFSVLQSGTW